MNRGLYAAATALDSAQTRHEVTAYNLAHATTPGYRGKGTINESFDRILGRVVNGEGDLLGTKVTGTYTNFQPGGIQTTGNPLDLAIENDAFFVLNSPDGPVYTRNGSFRLTAEGTLVSNSGYPVQGAGGPILLPPSGNITIARDGTITADTAVVGKISLARFTDPGKLQDAGPTLFRAPQEAGLQLIDTGVVQYAREASNVSPAYSMIELIGHQRYFDAAQRVLRAIGEAIQLNTRPQ